MDLLKRDEFLQDHILDNSRDDLLYWRIDDGFAPWIPFRVADFAFIVDKSIEVDKINLDTKKWEEVEDLGDVASFVGNNSSMYIHASGMNNCKRNCIYFN